MTTKTAEKKKKAKSARPKTREPWQVVLYNDDVHSFDEVILQVQKATGCTLPEATRITLEAHNRGKAIAFFGEFDKCFRVVQILRQIQLVVEIQG